MKNKNSNGCHGLLSLLWTGKVQMRKSIGYISAAILSLKLFSLRPLHNHFESPEYLIIKYSQTKRDKTIVTLFNRQLCVLLLVIILFAHNPQN